MNKINESKIRLMERKQTREVQSLIEQAVFQQMKKGKIDEGLWDSIKYGLAKLTSLRKMLPNEKRAAAQAQIDKILARADAASNKAFAELNSKLKASGYPNQKDANEFLEQTKQIGLIYDSIVASVKKGETSAKVANDMIKDLRKVLQFYMDHELESVYKRLAEAEGEEEDPTAGPLTGGFETSSMEELRSKIAPLVLALGGMVGVLGGVLMKTKWFFNLITESIWQDGLPQSELVDVIVKQIGPQQGEGVSQMVGRLVFQDPNHYGPNTKVSELLAGMKSINLSPEALASLGEDPYNFEPVWKALTSNPTATLGKVFGAKTPGGMEWSVDPEKVINVVEQVTQTVYVPVKKTVLKGALATIGTAALTKASIILPALGVGLLVSGAAVYFLRKHGQKYSRLATLDGLLQTMKDVEPGAAGEPTAPGEPGEPGTPGEPEKKGEEGDKKTGGKGEVIHIFAKGPHKFIGQGKRDMNLVDDLRGVNLPSWAIKAVTDRIKKELENKDFVVKEGLQLNELLEEAINERRRRKKNRDSRRGPKPRDRRGGETAPKRGTTSRDSSKDKGGRTAEKVSTGGADRAARAAADAAAKVRPAMARDIAGPGDNKGKIARMVIEFGQDTTVVKDGKTLKFSRKQLFDNPDEFIAALSPEEKALLMRLPEDPNRERSKFDFFTMTTDERKELYLKMKQGKVDFEKDYKSPSKEKELEQDKFFMSDLRDILETGHTAKFLQTGDPKDKQQPIDPEVIRAAMERIRNYLGDYLDGAGIVMRETVELNRWAVLAGIKPLLRG